MLPKKAQENNGWMATESGSKTPDFTERVVLATKDTKIIYVKDIRTAWKQLIAKLNILLGGTDQTLPTTEELELMINFAHDHWFKMSLTEIELAVTANISHKTEEHVKFFGKISVSYLQSCITNYEAVRRKAVLDHRRREEAMKPRRHPDEPDHITNAKLWAGLVQFTVQNNRIPDLWDWYRCYDHLEAEKGEGWISLEEKKRIYQEQSDIILKSVEKAKKESTTLAEFRDLQDVDMKQQIKNACQKYIIHRELAQFIK